MKVCVLSDESIDEFNPSSYLQDHEWDMVTVEPPIHEFIHEISIRKSYDVYLNIFEGFGEDDNSGFEVVTALESLNLPFTGAGTEFYNPTREHMQGVAEAHGISFARGFNAGLIGHLAQANDLRFPLIVKHPNSFGSTGLTRESRVNSLNGLEEQFKCIAGENGSARVEEFIDGRELTCLVVDNPDDLNSPYAYPPAEISFPAGETFLHVDVKWVNWDTYVVRLEEKDIATSVQELSKKFYQAMRGIGYGRVDLRMRPNGELVIIEINPNCGILYAPEDRGPADLPISWDRDGHKGFLDRIFRAAILRQKARTG